MELCPRHQISYDADSYCPGCVAGLALLEDAGEQETPIAVLGDYELISELGRGGMGVVYLARQSGLNRRVALKLLPSGNLAGQEFIQRFRREGELAASLQHPNIVRIFEAGQAEGELFYSMELITGGSLADWKDGKTHRPRDAANILRIAALAVDHAHENGILHRDLKPSNILIDEDGNPKIADFGLARLLDSQHEITLTSHSFGSPAYLAPELIRDPRAAAPASDIYSLGAILYFLLTGRSPFVSASLDELLRQVRESEPPPPRILNPSVPKDLQKICLKALDKNPAKRYLTARDLGDDLQRFLDNRPVLAQPAGPFIKTVRFARRSPWLTASLGLLALALIGGIGGIIRQSNIANQRADETARKAGELRLNLYAGDISAASTALRRGDTPLADQILSRWENPAPGEDLRGFEWRLLRQQSRPTPHHLVDSRTATITQLAISPDGQEIAVADQSGKILINLKAAALPFSANEVAAIPSSFGGGWVVGTSDGEVHWLDPGLRSIAKFPGRQFSLSADLPRAVVGVLPRFHWNRKAGAATVIDWKTGQTLRHFPGEWRHVVISPNGKTVALSGLDGGLRIIDIESGAIRNLPTQAPVWALSFNHSGTKIAAGSRRAAIIWDLSDASPAPLVIPHDLTVWTTSFSSDSSRFLTSSSDRQVRVWRTDQLTSPPVTLSGHRSEVWCAAFSPDGRTVVAGGKDGAVLGWHLDDPNSSSERIGHDHSNPPFISPDGRYLATFRENRSRILDLKTDSEVTLPPGVVSLGSSPDGRTLYLSDGDNRTGTAPFEDPTVITLHPAPEPAAAPHRIRAISKGRWIARLENSGEIQLLRPSDGAIIHRLKGQRPRMRHCVAGSPDGNFVAIGGDGENALVLHHLATGTSSPLVPSSSYYYVCAAFSEDGTMLAAGDLSGPIRVWNVRTRKLVATLPGHPEETSAVAFSPHGRTLASMGHLQDLKLWHTSTWRELHSVNLPDAGYHLAFTPDGDSLIATMGLDRSERIQWFPTRGGKRAD